MTDFHEEEGSQTKTVYGTLLVSENMKLLFLNPNFLQIKGIQNSTFYETDTMQNCNESPFSSEWNILSS